MGNNTEGVPIQLPVDPILSVRESRDTSNVNERASYILERKHGLGQLGVEVMRPVGGREALHMETGVIAHMHNYSVIALV